MLVGRFCDLWTKPGWLTLCYAKLTGFWPMWAVCMAQHKNWMHSRIIISNDIKHIEPFPYIHKMYFFHLLYIRIFEGFCRAVSWKTDTLQYKRKWASLSTCPKSHSSHSLFSPLSIFQSANLNSWRKNTGSQLCNRGFYFQTHYTSLMTQDCCLVCIFIRYVGLYKTFPSFYLIKAYVYWVNITAQIIPTTSLLKVPVKPFSPQRFRDFNHLISNSSKTLTS